jgi:hypothetical protein
MESWGQREVVTAFEAVSEVIEKIVVASGCDEGAIERASDTDAEAEPRQHGENAHRLSPDYRGQSRRQNAQSKDDQGRGHAASSGVQLSLAAGRGVMPLPRSRRGSRSLSPCSRLPA